MSLRTASAFFAVCAVCFGGFAFGAQEAAPQLTPSRLNVPVTPVNSVLVDFGKGAILRVPKTLIDPALIPKDPKQPIKLDQISMIFQFPEMTETVYPSPMEIIFEKQAKKYVPKPDRFPVFVKWLFHSEEGANHDWSKQPRPITIWESKWRPSANVEALAINIRESAHAHHVADDKLTFSDAIYEGLRVIHIPVTDPEYQARAEKVWRSHGWDGKSEVWYMERVGSPYELYMECDPVDSPNSSKCTADVYIKSSHLQYHMLFPPEAVAHTDELIKAINKMIASWSKK